MTINRKKGQTFAAEMMRNVTVVDAETGLPSGILTPSSACSITSVGDAATSTELLAANTSRKWATIFNDSTAILYVACTETASATNFTAKLLPYESCDIEGFTGVVNGIWASDAGGNARVSEFT